MGSNPPTPKIIALFFILECFSDREDVLLQMTQIKKPGCGHQRCVCVEENERGLKDQTKKKWFRTYSFAAWKRSNYGECKKITFIHLWENRLACQNDWYYQDEKNKRREETRQVLAGDRCAFVSQEKKTPKRPQISTSRPHLWLLILWEGNVRVFTFDSWFS